MRFQIFNMPGEWDDMAVFLTTEGINIKYQKIIPVDKDHDRVYVYYDYAAEVAEAENEALGVLMDKARLVKDDSQYYALKNGKQREIYLLSIYNITAGEAGTVMELLKPELLPLLDKATKAREVCA